MCAREEEKEGLKAILVTPEWVYSSVKAGNKQPSNLILLLTRSGDVLFFDYHFGSRVISKTELDFPASDSFRPLHVSHRWVLVECLVQAFLLPTAPFEFSPFHEHNNPSFSAARRFCQSILSPTNAHTTVSISRRTIRLRGPRLPVLPFEVLAKIFIEFRDMIL
ncbi:hypothetical protein B0H16DRAFT_1520712, partial [Mycena metata]